MFGDIVNIAKNLLLIFIKRGPKKAIKEVSDALKAIKNDDPYGFNKSLDRVLDKPSQARNPDKP